jgi:transposase-like protein
MSDNKKKMGRPSTYKPEYCQIVIEIMSRGESMAAVGAELGVGRSVLMKWREDHHDFLEACETGQALAQKWWEKLAMSVATGHASTHEVYKKANYGMIMFMMSRRFPDYYNKTQTALSVDSKGNSSNTITFETQLANGLIRQEQKMLLGGGGNKVENIIDVMVDEVVEEVCPTPQSE